MHIYQTVKNSRGQSDVFGRVQNRRTGPMVLALSVYSPRAMSGKLWSEVQTQRWKFNDTYIAEPNHGVEPIVIDVFALLR